MDEAVKTVSTSKEDWFAIALDTLLNEGVEWVKVLTLTEKLGASRSSFYWFFKNRGDLLDQLLALWERKNTAAILSRAGRPAASITEAVLNVFECWITDEIFDVNLDRAVRDWGRNDARVAAAVAAADDARVEALSTMFAAQGYPEGEAFIRARVLYLTQIGYYAVAPNEDIETRLSYVQHYMMALTGCHASDAEIARYLAFSDKTSQRNKREKI